MKLSQLNNAESKCLMVFVAFLFCPQPETNAQKINFKPENAFFIDQKKNTISDKNNTLDVFYKRLKDLHTAGSSKVIPEVVSILHIGDSHIQADFLSGQIRQNFQKDFGNAGRGLIAPLKLANTNEPRDYKITSPETWSASRCIQANPTYRPGVAGMTIACNKTACELEISLLRPNNYFRKITVFHAPNEDYFIQCRNKGVNKNYGSTTFNLPSSVSSIQLGIESTNESTIELHGFNLETGKKGVLYHAVGINGAQFLDYTNKKLFLSQSAQLQPALIIISLGTNEAYRKDFSSSIIYEQIDQLVKSLKKHNPNACFLLTTPAAGFRKEKNKLTPNENIEVAGREIKRYAEKNQLAYWDIFQLSGGEYASENWLENGLMAKDGIHFNQEGYILQGNLLYQALINGYNRFVSTRLE